MTAFDQTNRSKHKYKISYKPEIYSTKTFMRKHVTNKTTARMSQCEHMCLLNSCNKQENQSQMNSITPPAPATFSLSFVEPFPTLWPNFKEKNVRKRWISVITPFSMVFVWQMVPSAAGMLLVMQRLLLLMHQSSLQTSCVSERTTET